MIPGARGGAGSRGAAPAPGDLGGKGWNFFRPDGTLWHCWGNENPRDENQGVSDTTTSVAGIHDQLRAQPTIFSRVGIISDLMVPLSISGTADSRMWLAIYQCNPDTLYPTTRIWDSGSVLVNTVASGGLSASGWMVKPNARVTAPGVYWLAWTVNSAFGSAPACSFMYSPPIAANKTIPFLGVVDRGWSPGFNSSTLVTYSRASMGWAIQSFPFAQPPATFPGTAATTPMPDGSTVGLSYAGTSQAKGGGSPIRVLFRFQR
jgi:hypothetical protein